MFKKLAALKPSSGKKEKCRIDLEIVDISGLPPQIRECRVVWIRKASCQLTPSKVVKGGVARFRGQTMTQVASVHRNKAGECTIKDFAIKVQAPSTGDRIATFCKTPLDLSKYMSNTPETSSQTDVIPLLFKVGPPTTGYMKFNITCTHLGEMAEDGMTEMSGLTSEVDQDLDGFEMPPSRTGSMRSVRTNASSRVPSEGVPSSFIKHEKKGSFQSKFMSKINSLGLDSARSGRQGQEEVQSQASNSNNGDLTSGLAGQGSMRSSRQSDSGSGHGEQSARPAPDFGKKTGPGSIPGQQRPSEFRPPAPPDFGKKYVTSLGSGLFNKSARPNIDVYAQEYEAALPKPPVIERPKTQTKKGLMGFMQEQEEEDEDGIKDQPTNPTLQAASSSASSRQQQQQAAEQQQEWERGLVREKLLQQQQRERVLERERQLQQEERERELDRAKQERERQQEEERRLERELQLEKERQQRERERERQQQLERERRLAAPIIWRGSKAESKIPLPSPALQSAPKAVEEGQAPTPFQAPPGATSQAAPTTAPTQPAPPTATSTTAGASTAATAAAVAAVLEPTTAEDSKAAALSGSLIAPSDTTAAAADRQAAATSTLPAVAAGEQGDSQESTPGRSKLESASSIHTMIVKHDSLPSSVCSSPPAEQQEVTENAESPAIPGIKTERKRMQPLASPSKQVDAPSQQQQDEMHEPEHAKEGHNQQGSEPWAFMEQVSGLHQDKSDMFGSAPSAAGVNAVKEETHPSSGGRGSGNSPWATASSGGVASPEWANNEQAPTGPVPDSAAEERCRSLQAMCSELQQQVEAERQAGASLRQQLEAARAQIEAARAEQGAYGQPQQHTEAHTDIGELHRRVQEAEMIAAGIKRSNEALMEELQMSKQSCARLENLVCQGLSNMGHHQALEAVACFQAKHERLLQHSQQMEADFMDEADSLVAQLLDAMQQLEELSARLPEDAVPSDRPRTQFIEAPHAHTLRMENEALVQQLVARQMELAGALEEKAMLRRDLYRSKEINLKVANKMTNLQSQLLTIESDREMRMSRNSMV